MHRDDKVFLLDRLENGNPHDVVSASGSNLQLTAWPEDFIIEPDPAPPGTTTTPRPANAGAVLIVAALPDPVGADQGHESVTVLNILQLQLGDRVRLGNKRDSLLLLDADGGTVDQVSYEQRQVRRGRTICFGREQ